MFEFIFGKKEGVALADALAAKSDEALASTLGMLLVRLEGTPPRAMRERLALEAFKANPEIVERMLVALPETTWTVVLAALEKGPQPITAPGGLEDEAKELFLTSLSQLFAGLPFTHVLPAAAEADAPRVVVVDEMRARWKSRRRELLDRRGEVERLIRLAAAAANLYGCIDVERFAALLGGAAPSWCTPQELELLLESGAMSGDAGFECDDGEILHAELAGDRAAHARVRRAHIGKDPRALSPEDLIACADEKALLPQDLLRQAVRALESALPKPFAGEAKEIATGFAQGCRRGEDVAELLRGFMALARMSGGGDEPLDFSALSPLYNGVPLWEEFGSTREQAGKAVPFHVDGGTATGTQTREGPQVGRNDPCPCGSGKKYKKCCGRGL